MTHRQLECFLKTAELLSISKAAKALYISQPSLSEQIKKLEEELEVKLFIRSNKNLKLTSAGKTLIGETYELFAKEQELKDAVRTAGIISKRVLRIRYLAGPFNRMLPDLVNRFHQKHPEIMIELYDTNWNTLTNEMNSTDYDISFYLRLGDCDIPQTNHIDFITRKVDYMMSKNHPLASQKELSFDQIRHEMFCLDILPEPSKIRYTSIYEIFKSHKVSSPNIIPAKSMESAIVTIKSGFSIGIASKDFLPIDTSDLVFVPSPELPTASLSIYWNTANDNPATQEFIRFCQENI